MQAQTPKEPTALETPKEPTALAPADNKPFDKIWPPTMMALGLGLSATWTFFLAYGLYRLIELAY